MATASSGWRCIHSTSVISYNNTSDTIRVTCYWKNEGWNYSVNYVSAYVYCNGQEKQVKWSSSVSAPDNYGQYSMGYADFTINKTTSEKYIPCYAKIVSNSSYAGGTKTSSSTSVYTGPKPSYTIKYNANGGSGAPSNQTKWYGTNLTLSSTKPSRTGYSFTGWATSASGSVAYQPGGTYSANAAVTLYAIWKADTYTVSYNANGGSGAPANQTKTYGVNLTLSSTKPTRTNYNFLGWSTSANGNVTYKPGETYSSNSAITLYAIWSIAYIKPRLNNFSVQRCDSDGTLNESGTYVKVSFDWSTDKTVTSIKIEWKIQNGNTWSSANVSATGTSGAVNQVVGTGEISNENTYAFRAYVSDSSTIADDGTTYSQNLSVGTIKFPIDIKNGGTGIAFGKVAESNNTLDTEWNGYFRKTLKSGGINLTPGDKGPWIGFYANFEDNINNTNKKGYIGFPSSSNNNLAIVNSTGDKAVNATLSNTGDLTITGRTISKGLKSARTFRQTNANIAPDDSYSGSIECYGATSSMTSNKPSIGDGHILHFHWDNTDGYDSQLFIRNTTGQFMSRGSSSGTWGKWGSFPQGYSLYENLSGSNGTITLSDTIDNYKYIEIITRSNDGYIRSSKFMVGVGSYTGHSLVDFQANTDTDLLAYLKVRIVKLVGTTISTIGSAFKEMTFSNNSSCKVTNNNMLYIVKVIGYR